MNNHRGFIPILILIVVAIVIAGGAYVILRNRTPQSPVISNRVLNATTTLLSSYSTPAGWKHYQSSMYNFSFDYPSSLTPALEMYPKSAEIIRLLDAKKNVFMSIQATSNTHIETNIDPFLLNPPCKNSEARIGKRNILSLRKVCSAKSGFDDSDGIAVNASTSLVISYASPSNSEEVSKILRSFDRIQNYTVDFSPSPVISTQGWKHYQDATYRFSFDYPPNATVQTEKPKLPQLEVLVIDSKDFLFSIIVSRGSISMSTSADQFCGYQPEEVKIGKQGTHFLRGNCGDAGEGGQFYVGALSSPGTKITIIASGDEPSVLGVFSSIDGIVSYKSALAR